MNEILKPDQEYNKQRKMLQLFFSLKLYYFRKLFKSVELPFDVDRVFLF